MKIEHAHPRSIFIINIIEGEKNRKVLDIGLQRVVFFLKRELENKDQEQDENMGVDEGENQSINKISNE